MKIDTDLETYKRQLYQVISVVAFVGGLSFFVLSIKGCYNLVTEKNQVETTDRGGQ